MPNPVIGLVGASIGGSVISAGAQASAARRGAAAQERSAEMGIEEQRRQFDAITELLAPYVEAGTAAIPGLQPFQEAGIDALAQQRALAGLDGPEAQQAAIQMIEQSPQFEAMTRQGEEAILQSAGATGGLRGGNVQAALAQFRPQVLSGLIEQQYGRFGGLAGSGLTTTQNIMQSGQAAAARQAASGMQSAQNISNLFAQQGAAQSGAALAQGRAMGGLAGNIAGSVGYGLGAFATPLGTPGGLPEGATLFGRWGF